MNCRTGERRRAGKDLGQLDGSLRAPSGPTGRSGQGYGQIVGAKGRPALTFRRRTACCGPTGRAATARGGASAQSKATTAQPPRHLAKVQELAVEKAGQAHGADSISCPGCGLLDHRDDRVRVSRAAAPRSGVGEWVAAVRRVRRRRRGGEGRRKGRGRRLGHRWAAVWTRSPWRKVRSAVGTQKASRIGPSRLAATGEGQRQADREQNQASGMFV